MIVHYLTEILVAVGVFSMGMFSPGPNIMSIIGTSMASGRSSGQALALGIASGSFLWGALTLFGLTALLTVYAGLLTIIKIAGTAYLLFLALPTRRSRPHGKGKQWRCMASRRKMG